MYRMKHRAMVERLPEAGAANALDRMDDNNRPERYINRFVILQAVVLMAIRGLGVLAFAWSTVVLLGGFVTLLEKDFWCITVLSLLQTARIFNALADELYRYFVDLLFDTILEFVKSIWKKVYGRTEWHRETKTQQRKEDSDELARLCQSDEKKKVFRRTYCDPWPCFSKKVVGYKMTFMLLLLPLIIVVCHPVLVVFLSITLSSIRLKQEDYGQGGANLIPAMVIFYSLALAQGVLYLFWLILTILEHQMVKLVAKECEFESARGHNYISRYLTDTRSKCLKDLSASRERNMITHASDMMDSDYKDDYISGARMLVTFIEKKKLPVKTLVRFSRSRIQKLILILAWRDPDDMEIRLLAAKIVAHIAGDISLAQFPGTLECLSSLLKVSEENAIFTSPLKNDTEGGTSMEEGEAIMENVIHSEERRQGQNSGRILKDRQKNVTAKHDIDTQQYTNIDGHFSHSDECQLTIQGFLILEKLCSNDHNCIQICNAQLVITHMLAWVFSRPFLYPGEKDHWVTILTISFSVLARLSSIRGQPAEQVRDKIIFELYPSCISGYATHPMVYTKAIYTFSHAYTREKFCVSEIRKRDRLVTILLGLFSFEKIKQLESDELMEMRVKAGEALSRLCIYRDNCVAIIKYKGHIVTELSEMIDCCEIAAHRAIAANILMRLISHYKGDQPDKRLQKVLQQLFSICEEEKQGNNTPKRQGCVPAYVRTHNLSDTHYDLKKLQATLVRIIYIMLSKKQLNKSQFEDTVRQWESRSTDGNGESFLQLLKMLVDRNIRVAEANPLEIIKWVARLVELMVNNKIMAVQEIVGEGIIDSLSKACDTMSNIDSWILYLGTHNRGAVFTTTLSSIVDDIRKELRKQGKDQPCTIVDELEGEEFWGKP